MQKTLITLSILLWFVIVLAGCKNDSEANPTVTLLPALGIAVEATQTATEVLPTDTPLPTATLPEPTLEPTLEPTQEPPTLEPTLEPTIPSEPTGTPYPSVTYLNDQWQQISVPNTVANGLDRNWLAFTNYNDTARAATSNTTAEPANLNQKLYLVRPDTRQRVEIAEIPVSAGERIYWSPAGTHVVYFAEDGIDEAGNQIGGLYMLDFNVGLQYRLFNIRNLNPRGIAGHVPVWSADGSKLAIVLPTEYATDIFIMNADGTNFRNLTNSGSYDLFPAFSPDGLWMAFVSDRAQCPTWVPNEPSSCAQLNALPPNEGNLYIMNLNTGEIRQITDVKLTGAPRWITATKLEFATGGNNALAENSTLWLVDIEAGSAVQVSPSDSLSISESWSNDAQQVIYQRAANTSALIVADNLGREIANSTDYSFPRFGMAADWSQDGQYIAIAGRNGQCPYGILVVQPNFEVVTAPAQNLLACDPRYAPDSNYLAFTAIRPSVITDGSLDIYIANINGLGAANVTSDMQGQIHVLGWVGIPAE